MKHAMNVFKKMILGDFENEYTRAKKAHILSVARYNCNAEHDYVTTQDLTRHFTRFFSTFPLYLYLCLDVSSSQRRDEANSTMIMKHLRSV